MKRFLLPLSLLFFVLLPAICVSAQSYTSVVVFGDSLSDTGNIAHLAQSSFAVRYPGPLFNYTDGRFTDGTDTLPAATAAHTGVWVEQLAANFPNHPAVVASLDGGTNFAYGDATTAAGTTTVSEAGLSLTLNNMGQQVTDYLAAHPAVPAGTLVIVWGGANDLSAAATATSPQQVQTIISTAVANEVALVQQLLAAGATDVLVPNLPPLGLVPDFNGNVATSAAVTAAAQLFNTGLATGLGQLGVTHPGVHLFQLDTFALVNTVVSMPATYNLTNVTAKAQGQPVNPDQYLFWDGLHPTTTGHALLAMAAGQLLAPPSPVATTTALASSALTANLGSSVIFTATVSAASGAPSGTVTFSEGNTTLGTGALSASGATSSTATFSTSSLSAGTHTITAAYGGGTGFAASTSGTITQTIVAPSVAATLAPTTLTVTRGASGTVAVTLTPAGGFSGTVQVACGNLPAYAGCTSDAPLGGAYSFSGSSNPQTATITITTDNNTAPVPAVVLFPIAGLGLLAVTRRRHLRAGLLGIVVALTGTGLLALAGCSDSGKRTASGTYTVPITVTPSAGSATTLNLSLVVK